MTQHPEELLAEYVDGTLADEDRARVEAHLATCEACREEVALAGRARAALRALPAEEPPALTLPVRRTRALLGPRALRLAAAGAAALVLAGGLLFLSLPRGGEEEAETAAEAPAEPAAPEEEVAPPGAAAESALDALRRYPEFRPTGAAYGAEDLQPLARDLADEAKAALAAGFPPTSLDFYADFDVGTLRSRLAAALQCAIDAVEGDRDLVPFVVEEATIEDLPVYIASFLKGPEPDQPYDLLQVVVVDRDTCAIRTAAFQRL